MKKIKDNDLKMVAGLAGGLAFGIAVGIAFGLAVGIAFGLAVGIAFGLAAGLAAGIAAGLAAGIAAGLAAGRIHFSQLSIPFWIFVFVYLISYPLWIKEADAIKRHK